MNWTKEEQAEHRALLVNALRSGSYKQTRAPLRDGDAYCFLGLACEISGLGHWTHLANAEYGAPEYTYTVKKPNVRQYWVEQTILPYPVMNWLGFTYQTGAFDLAATRQLDSCPSQIAAVLDDEIPTAVTGIAGLLSLSHAGITFDMIADFIEAAPPGLLAA